MMQDGNNEAIECINYHDHFQKLRPLIREVTTSKHFLRDAPDFDVTLVLDSKHQYFTHLHKLEETIHGHHIFRALWKGKHIIYAVDKNHRLVFMRAFESFKSYRKFLEDKKMIQDILEERF
jgi:hypothetical protein